MIYFDYTTTPIDDEILTFIFVLKTFANSTSLHKLGQSSNYLYNKATDEIKELLNIIIILFILNATEANLGLE